MPAAVWAGSSAKKNTEHIEVIRSDQPLRRQTAPSQRQDADQRIQNERPAHVPAALSPSYRHHAGTAACLALCSPAELKGSHLGHPVVCFQGEHLLGGLLQKEHSIFSGHQWGLWGWVGAPRASSPRASPAELWSSWKRCLVVALLLVDSIGAGGTTF